MFVVGEKAKKEPEIEEIPGEDAGVIELVRYNGKRLSRKYLGDATQRKLVLNVVCFAASVVCLNQFGDLLSV